MLHCKDKHILGKPNEGFHKHYFGFAFGDLVATVIFAFMLMLIIKRYIKSISHSLLFGIILLILLIIAEYLHYIFCLRDNFLCASI